MADIVRFVLRLPPALHEDLKALAEREQRSLHGQLLYLLSSEPDQASNEQIEDAYARGFENGHEKGYEKGYEDAEEKEIEKREEEMEEKARTAYEKGLEEGYEKAREEVPA